MTDTQSDQAGFVRGLIAGEASDQEVPCALLARKRVGASAPVSKEGAAIEVMIAGERSK